MATIVKGSSVIGLKIITLQDGREVGKVKDIIFNPDSQYVEALLIDEGGVLRDTKVIDLPTIKSIGKDAVIIDQEQTIKKADDIPKEVVDIAKGDTYLTKTKIMTETGDELGQISDVYFDEKTGKVTEFEVSQGVFQNAASGKKRVKITDIVTVGKDSTIVRSTVQDSFSSQAQTGGLQGRITTIQEKTPQIVSQAKRKSGDVIQRTKIKSREFMEKPETQDVINRVKQTGKQLADTAKYAGAKAGRAVQNRIDDRSVKETSEVEVSKSGTIDIPSRKKKPRNSR